MMTSHKVKCSISIEDEVYRLAQARSRRRDITLSTVLAQAAEHHLLGLKTEESVLLEQLQQLTHLERREHAKASFDLHVIQEMLGLFVRTFYLYVPPVANTQDAEVQRVSQLRYERFMETLAQHIRERQSVLSRQLEPQNLSGQPVPTSEEDPKPDDKTNGTASRETERNPTSW